MISFARQCAAAAWLAAAAALAPAAWLATGAPKPEITVAAAANLTDVFRRIGAAFEAETGIRPVFSFASTAQLTRQIENGAPFDVFAAADSEHVERLEREGLLAPRSRAVYAQGVLVLWIPRANSGIRRIEDLTLPSVRVIAIAKPELAPYGEAALAVLKSLGVWNQLQPKIVYAENINMAKQYGVSGNADAVFIAAGLARNTDGIVLPIPSKLYPPIDQCLGIIARSARQQAARKFADFLLRGKGREMLAEAGYRIP
jgi:molybdate transport system substrate-binding protein